MTEHTIEKKPDNWSGASTLELNQAVVNYLYFNTSKDEKYIYPSYARRIDQAMLLAGENHFSIMPVFRDDKFIGWWAGQAVKME
ncbi:MAG TPA: hypothetical protein VFF78_08000, partial [Anaerolineaceae bacterium]|nr:hypothetical protein [Anaerolineaceae bacterium]